MFRYDPTFLLLSWFPPSMLLRFIYSFLASRCLYRLVVATVLLHVLLGGHAYICMLITTFKP